MIKSGLFIQCIGKGGTVVEDRQEEIIKQYDFTVKAKYRARGAVILETDKGLRLLKSMEGSEKHLEFVYKMTEKLHENGFTGVDRIVKNKEGTLLSKDGSGNRYIVKEWFQGEECNLKETVCIKRSVKALARCHRILEQNEDLPEGRQKGSSIEETLHRHNREMKRIRTYIRDKTVKNQFETDILNSFEMFYGQAELATGMLEHSSYKKMLEEAGKKKTVVHGNFNQHNILFAGDITAFTNFTKAGIGIQITDLYQFLRKTMEKNQWNPEIGEMMIEAYNSVHPIDKDAMELLYILVLYPEKYWKIINFYYNSKKAWIPVHNIEKLERIRKQEEAKRKFLEKLKGVSF